MPSPLLAGIKISPRFAEALGMAEEKAPVQEENKVNLEAKIEELYRQIEELKTKPN